MGENEENSAYPKDKAPHPAGNNELSPDQLAAEAMYGSSSLWRDSLHARMRNYLRRHPRRFLFIVLTVSYVILLILIRVGAVEELIHFIKPDKPAAVSGSETGSQVSSESETAKHWEYFRTPDSGSSSQTTHHTAGSSNRTTHYTADSSDSETGSQAESVAASETTS